MHLEHLFSPVRLGRMEVRNRLVMPPMSVNFGVDDRPIDPDAALLVRGSALGG